MNDTWEYLDNRTRDGFRIYGSITYRFIDTVREPHYAFIIEYDARDKEEFPDLRWRIMPDQGLSPIDALSIQMRFSMDVRRLQFTYTDICRECMEDHVLVLHDYGIDISED